MLVVCMTPLEKHCSKLRVISQQICNVKKAANSHCVCHELKAHDTHNVTCFHCDIIMISHHIQADTLDANFAEIIAGAEYFNIIFCDKMNRRRLAG